MYHIGGELNLNKKYEELPINERAHLLDLFKKSGFLLMNTVPPLPENFSSFNPDFPYNEALGLLLAQRYSNASTLILGCGRFIPMSLTSAINDVDANCNSCNLIHDRDSITVNVDISQNPDVLGNFHKIFNFIGDNTFKQVIDETGWALSIYDKDAPNTIRSISRTLKSGGIFIIHRCYERDERFIKNFSSLEKFKEIMLKEYGLSLVKEESEIAQFTLQKL